MPPDFTVCLQVLPHGNKHICLGQIFRTARTVAADIREMFKHIPLIEIPDIRKCRVIGLPAGAFQFRADQ